MVNGHSAAALHAACVMVVRQRPSSQAKSPPATTSVQIANFITCCKYKYQNMYVCVCVFVSLFVTVATVVTTLCTGISRLFSKITFHVDSIHADNIQTASLQHVPAHFVVQIVALLR